MIVATSLQPLKLNPAQTILFMMGAGNKRNRAAELAGIFAAQIGVKCHLGLMSGTVFPVVRPLRDRPDAAVLAGVVVFEWIWLHFISSGILDIYNWFFAISFGLLTLRLCESSVRSVSLWWPFVY